MYFLESTLKYQDRGNDDDDDDDYPDETKVVGFNDIDKPLTDKPLPTTSNDDETTSSFLYIAVSLAATLTVLIVVFLYMYTRKKCQMKPRYVS